MKVHKNKVCPFLLHCNIFIPTGIPWPENALKVELLEMVGKYKHIYPAVYKIDKAAREQNVDVL